MSATTDWRVLESSKDLPMGLLREIVSRLHYCSQDLQEFRIDEGGDRIVYRLRDDVDASEVERILDEAVECLEKGYREPKTRISFDRRDVPLELHHDIIETLEESGELHFAGPGRVHRGGRVQALEEALDTLFLEIAATVDAEPHNYPNLISVDALERCDYFASFPQYLTFACHLREDLDTLRSFSQRVRHGREISIDDLDQMAPPREVLSPTVCFHCFEHLQDQDLPAGETKAITARANCYRYEAGNLKGLERLWDFSMREIVLFGPVEQVRSKLDTLHQQVHGLVDALELNAWIESATDAFFLDDFAKKSAFQSTFDLKQELRLAIPGGSLAAASMNFHNDFFCGAYDISVESNEGARGGPLVSACVGFGLERFVYAVLSQKGIDPKSWPTAIRQKIERE